MRNNSKKAFTILELVIVILVIGAIVGAVVESKVLLEQSKVKAAKKMSYNSPALSITGDDDQRSLVAWFDALDTDTIVMSSNVVSEWRSKVGEINASQVTAGNRPTYVAEGITHFPAIEFDGVDDYLQLNRAVIGGADDSYTIAAVFNSDIENDWQVIYEQADSDNATGTRLSLLLSNSAGFCYAFQGSNVQAGSYAANRPNSLVAVNDNGAIKFYLNNATYSSASIDASTLNAATDVAFIGRQEPDLTQQFDGKISEILIFDKALDANEIEEVRSYLTTKYNIK